MVYETYIFGSCPDWSVVPVAQINRFHWEGTDSYRPDCFAKLCAVKRKGLFAKLWAFEENPRCIYTERDDPVYKDSCLELFLQPIPGNAVYVNFEVNCRGVFLAQAGSTRNTRVFIKDLCTMAPVITPFRLTENGHTAWGVDLYLSEDLIGNIYNTSYCVEPGEIKGNFYKCGDDTPTPHYGAFFPVDSAVLGFHNPKKFGTMIINER